MAPAISPSTESLPQATQQEGCPGHKTAQSLGEGRASLGRQRADSPDHLGAASHCTALGELLCLRHLQCPVVQYMEVKYASKKGDRYWTKGGDSKDLRLGQKAGTSSKPPFYAPRIKRQGL